MLKKFFLSGVIYVAAFFTVQNNLGYIPVKLAYTYIYIPVYYWLIISACTFIYARIAKIRFLDLLPSMFILGISLQVYLMLLQLNQFLILKQDYERMYLYYAFMIETVYFSLTVYVLNRFFTSGDFVESREFYSKGIKINSYLCLPFAFNIIYQLYRDFFVVNRFYFYFHLAVLLCIPVLYSKRRYLNRFKTDKFIRILKREETVICLVFLLSFIARAVFSLHIIRLTQAGFPTASDDGPSYHGYALLIMQSLKNLFSGSEIIPTVFDPGYSIFLGFIYKIFGANFYAATIIQSLLNALMTVAVYLIAKELFNRKIAVISAVLVAVNQPLIMLSVVLTTEALYIPLLIFSIYSLILYRKYLNLRGSRFWLLLAGFFLSMAIVVRAMLLLFPVFLIFWLWLCEKRLNLLKSVACLFTGLTPVLVLITVVTYMNTGEVGMFTKKQDVNWTAFTTEMEKNEPGRAYCNIKLIEMGINPFKDPKGSALIILKHPVKFLKIESEILPLRLRLFLFYPNFGYFDPIFILTSTTPNQYASTLEFYVLIILALGLALAFLNKETFLKSSLIFLLIAYYLIIHVILTAGQCSRYRVPLVPFFIIFAANGLYIVYKLVLPRSIRE